MIPKLLIPLLLLSTFLPALSQTFTNSTVNVTSLELEYSAGSGIFITPPYQINTNTRTLTEFLPLSPCDYSDWVFGTPNGGFWCAGPSIINETKFSINQFDPIGLKINYSFPFIGNNNDTVMINPANDQLILMGYSGVNFTVFDTISKSVVCNFTNFTGFEFSYDTWYVNGTYIATSVDENLQVSILAVNCSTGSYFSSQLGNNWEIYNFFSTNQSSILGLFYEVSTGGSDYANYFVALKIDYANKQFLVGTPIETAWVYQLNDSYILSQVPDTETIQFAIYVFSPSLNGVVKRYIDTGIPVDALSTDDVPYFSVIAGQSIVNMLLNDGTRFLFNVNTGAITSVSVPSPQIVFKDGTIVNMTEYGYFIQRPGQNIQFVGGKMTPAYSTQQNPTTQYVMFFNENGTNCTVIQFQQSTGISVGKLNQCPYTSEMYLQLKDFQISGSTFWVAYQAAYNSYYIANSTRAFGPFTTDLLILTNAFSINVTGGYVIVAGSYALGVQVQALNLTTGQNLATQNVNGGLYGYVAKLTQQHFLFALTGLSSTNFVVFNVSSFSVQSQNSYPLTLGVQTNNFPFYAINISDLTPQGYSGVVITPKNQVLLYSYAGSFKNLTNPNIVEDNLQTSIYLQGGTQFVVVTESFYQNSITYYNVTSWGNGEVDIMSS